MPSRRSSRNRVRSGATAVAPEGVRRRGGTGWKSFAAALAGVLVAVVVFGIFQVREPPERVLAEARRERGRGRLAEAERLAARVLERDVASGEAGLLAAECASGQQAWVRAAGYLQKSAPAAPRLRLETSLKLAELEHRRLHRLRNAERAYRAVLEIDPGHVRANTGLAELLSLCIRRREAQPCILRLIQAGEETELLMLLARSEGIVNDPELLEEARAADPADPNPLVGLAWLAAEADHIELALELLDESLRRQRDHLPAHVLRGRLLIETNRAGDFADWLHGLPASADASGEAWFLRGQIAEQAGDLPGAIRCDWEALRRTPELKGGAGRLARLLTEAGETELAARFGDQVRRAYELEQVQNRVLFPGGERRADLLGELVPAFEAAGRLWEAYGWCRLAVAMNVGGPELHRVLQRLQQSVAGLPLQLMADSANVALSVDLSHYPLPRRTVVPATPKAGGSPPTTPLSFRDDARAAGLQFRFCNGVGGPPTQRMFEFTGGGLGMLDFDLDERPDLFCSQGKTWPPGVPDREHGDRLFQNRSDAGFVDVSLSAGIVEDGFGQGVTIGDWNTDGFPDVYVANIGRNRLWRNQGDGTFTDVTRDAGIDGDAWTTSVLLADLSGDGLPDIYDVNYVTAPDVFDRVCRHADGSTKMCMPFDFYPQPDQFWLNAGDGRFIDATASALGEPPLGMGLGIAAWDEDGDGRLSVFVANDTTPSFFFVRDSAPDGTFLLRERGIESGLALNGDGKATGCMGVALGDVDGDGRIDLNITNFLAEPNTLFVNPVAGVFEDRTRAAGLSEPSLEMLGFGTQFLDVDLDGSLDLFVANGHLDDLTRFGRPYRMPPQLFRGNGRGQFAAVPPEELGGYFQSRWLGRAAARLDWNRDGREDLAVGHLEDETALLTNTTADAGRALSLRLIGITSNRDALGTTVTARTGSKTVMRQLTAGDGYQASNERRLVIGLGESDTIDEMIVRWPSGLQQRFLDLKASGDWIVREGHPPLSVPSDGR